MHFVLDKILSPCYPKISDEIDNTDIFKIYTQLLGI